MTALPFGIYFDPLISMPWLITALCIAVLFTVISLRNWKNALCRLGCVLCFIMIFLNPSFIEKDRQKINDVAVIITDKSLSQNLDKRDERTQEAQLWLEEKAKSLNGVDIRTAEYDASKDDNDRTNLFTLLDKLFSDVPANRRAGAILLTDGQIHDIPQAVTGNNNYGPVHLYISGRHNEKDRRIMITGNPAYALIGKTAQVKYKVVDTNNINEETARVTVKISGREPEILQVPVNAEQTYEVPVEHAGQNIVEFEAETIDGEITTTNNRTLAFINGVRDRMRVLLVSGQPYAGGRTWRDLLKSDPNIDLVQFTILREPEKLDNTPSNEMALIAFPVRELFELKLYEFDLVIFDRYKLNHILPANYFNNIRNYIRDGGAFLEINGPGYAGAESLYDTILKEVLPAAPTGQIINEAFIPTLTDKGKLHPVTRNLPGDGNWGHWLRQIGVTANNGDVLMKGARETPLLILNHIEEGRIAQLSSDQIWLWSRNYDGGGPYTELLRRIIHWLMKEPELDETLLNITASGNQITLQSISHEDAAAKITMTEPDKTTREIMMNRAEDGSYKTTINVKMPGIYGFKTANGNEQYTIIGKINSPELNDIIAGTDKVKAFLKLSGGNTLWMVDNQTPSLKTTKAHKGSYTSSGGFTFRENNNYEVKNIHEIPLLLPWIGLCLLLAASVFAWWREGRH